MDEERQIGGKRAIFSMTRKIAIEGRSDEGSHMQRAMNK